MMLRAEDERKKKRKARKPPITEYTFSEASSESQEVSKRDKEAKKPVTGEYSFVTNIDDIESNEDEQVEKFTYLLPHYSLFLLTI